MIFHIEQTIRTQIEKYSPTFVRGQRLNGLDGTQMKTPVPIRFSLRELRLEEWIV
jgi:hypothetical protein